MLVIRGGGKINGHQGSRRIWCSYGSDKDIGHKVKSKDGSHIGGGEDNSHQGKLSSGGFIGGGAKLMVWSKRRGEYDGGVIREGSLGGGHQERGEDNAVARGHMSPILL